MGFGELLGVKNIKITLPQAMTIEEVYEKIKDIEFDAGKPEIVKHGFNTIIAFPPEDRENQVWVMLSKTTLYVQRSVAIAGLENMIKNSVKADVMDALTGGASGLISAFGNPKKQCMAHCDDAAEKIKAAIL